MKGECISRKGAKEKKEKRMKKGKYMAPLFPGGYAWVIL